MLKVICVSIEETKSYLIDRPLTIGKEYEVLDRLSSYDNYHENKIEIDEYLIMCDKNFECYYPTYMFITQREKNLDNLGI